MRRDKNYAALGRESAMRKIQEAQESASFLVNKYLVAKIAKKQTQYTKGEVCGSVIYFYNVMRPYLKKFMPETYNELQILDQLMQTPDRYIEKEHQYITCSKREIIQVSAFDNMEFIDILNFYNILYDSYIELDWGAPAPYVDEETRIEDYLEDSTPFGED